MTDISTIAGGRPPTNQRASSTFNPVVGTTAGFPDGYPAGTPVTQSHTSDGLAIPGRGNVEATATVLGLSVIPGIAGNNALCQMNGPLELTTQEWDAVTGGSGGLVRGSRYFLSTSVEGRITATQPLSSGQFLTVIGIAFSATTMFIQIGPTTVISGG